MSKELTPHTPGPWAIQQRCCHRGNNVGLDVVCSQENPQRFRRIAISPDTTSIESAANMQLIATAPELLKAVETLLAYHDRYYENEEEFADLDEVAYLQDVENIRQIVKKAKTTQD